MRNGKSSVLVIHVNWGGRSQKKKKKKTETQSLLPTCQIEKLLVIQSPFHSHLKYFIKIPNINLLAALTSISNPLEFCLVEAIGHQGPNNLIKGSRPPKWSEVCNNKADLRLLKKRPLETLSGHRHRPAKSAEAERGRGNAAAAEEELRKELGPSLVDIQAYK